LFGISDGLGSLPCVIVLDKPASNRSKANPMTLHIARPDYGIDAPGVRRGMLIAGCAGFLVALFAYATRINGVGESGVASVLLIGLGILGAVAGCYGLFMGGYMTYGSRVGKLRTRDRLLDQIGELRSWGDTVTLLDVGCGRGLLVIGGAKRLKPGGGIRAIGIDLWRTEDQAENSPQAALENARIEGVAERVQIDTGDAKALPYPDATFDVVMSHWVVHNLEDLSDRSKVLDEMLRVLRPGGVIVLADIAFVADYREHFESHGVIDIRFMDGGFKAQIMGLLSGGNYRPQALVGIRR
jgi:2-polyprenyl-3-methyl-5-hydroxy-6-metoxy-1,4-benzoquinol methylase